MTKASLVDYIAEKADLTKADAARALDAMLEGVEKGLKEEGKVTLVGFGTFSAKKREARTGRNPQTGEEVKIAARVVPNFKAGTETKRCFKLVLKMVIKPFFFYICYNLAYNLL